MTSTGTKDVRFDLLNTATHEPPRDASGEHSCEPSCEPSCATSCEPSGTPSSPTSSTSSGKPVGEDVEEPVGEGVVRPTVGEPVRQPFDEPASQHGQPLGPPTDPSGGPSADQAVGEHVGQSVHVAAPTKSQAMLPSLAEGVTANDHAGLDPENTPGPVGGLKRKRMHPIQITVQFLTGGSQSVSIDRYSLVRDLKKALHQMNTAPHKHMGLHPDRQKIVFDDILLKNYNTLSHYGLQDGSVVHMSIRLFTERF